MNKVAEIKKLYLGATAGTIARDLVRAIHILKSMNTEKERQRAAVYMDGLSQMRSEWAQGKKNGKDKRKNEKADGSRRNARDSLSQ